ncbi:MAG: hypothetical protein ACLQUT_05355 [Thermoleophilia bacterium]
MTIFIDIACLFVGFALGVVTVAMVVAGKRDDEDLRRAMAHKEQQRRLRQAAAEARDYYEQVGDGSDLDKWGGDE